MLGTAVNVTGIVIASLLGLLFSGKVGEKYSDIIFDGMAICVIVIGMMNALKVKTPLLMIISIVVGCMIGTLLRIDERLDRLSGFLMSKFASGKHSDSNSCTNDLIAENAHFSKGFITATLLFCVGSMSIVGPLQSSLAGDNTTLFSKTVLDSVAALILSSTFGIGVLFSAVPVLIYQGGISLCASSLGFLARSPSAVADIGGVGGILIIGIGLNILKFRDKPLLLGNMLPSVFIPVIYYAVVSII